jgi:hypothetical protein
MTAIERYKRTTHQIVRRFINRDITFVTCITRLSDALVIARPQCPPEDLPALCDMMLANNARVMGEMEKRERTKS